MKKFTVLMLTGLVALAFAGGAMAMENGKMEHKTMQHDGMAMDGDMIMLGTVEENGVKAMAHLKDVREAMGKMGMEQTHHIMVMFANAETGQAIGNGMAAVKIKTPTGEEVGPIKLMGMEGHFGADIVLPGPGEYQIVVGTKLTDGKKRQFMFSHTIE